MKVLNTVDTCSAGRMAIIVLEHPSGTLVAPVDLMEVEMALVAGNALLAVVDIPTLVVETSLIAAAVEMQMSVVAIEPTEGGYQLVGIPSFVELVVSLAALVEHG